VAVAVAVAVGAAELGAAELGAAELGVSGDGLPVGEVADETGATVRAAATIAEGCQPASKRDTHASSPQLRAIRALYFSVGGFSAGDLIGPQPEHAETPDVVVEPQWPYWLAGIGTFGGCLASREDRTVASCQDGGEMVVLLSDGCGRFGRNGGTLKRGRPPRGGSARASRWNPHRHRLCRDHPSQRCDDARCWPPQP